MNCRLTCFPGGMAMRHGFRFIVAVLLSAALTACVTRGGKIPYTPERLSQPDRPAPSDTAYDIPIGPLDVLRVNVFRVPELSGEYQVDAHGMLSLPLIGSISARDQSPEQFATLLEQAYGERYLNQPEITVRVISTNMANITIEGGVNAPGIYALPGKTPLLGAIALAKGIEPNLANPKRVAIFRKQQGRTVAAAFDVVAIRRDEMQDPLVYPGDTIVVDSSQLRQMYRDLLQSLPAFTLFNQL